MKLTPEQMKVCRINLGLTQGQLAREVGLTSGMIGHIERGERVMSTDIESKVRKAFGLSDAEIKAIEAAHKRLNANRIG